jgi:universal stress protein E
MMAYSQDRIGSICFLRTSRVGDDGAFERALRLCRVTGAELSIASVCEEPSAGILEYLASWGTSAEVIRGEAEQVAAGQQLAALASARGVKATSEVLHGNRFFAVSRKVQRDNHDLLIKAAESTHVIQQVLLGHTDRQLIRKCPCPVWIEKPTSGKTHDRVLVALDPAAFAEELEVDPLREVLNLAVLEYGLLLAQVEEAELHVVHAWAFDLEMALRSRAGLDEQAIGEATEMFRQRHELALTELIGPHMSDITRVHLVKGHAGEEISRVAAREAIDVIVMGTLCRTGVEGLLIGNTAETVLDHATCSIVALKPDGFVSPVRE